MDKLVVIEDDANIRSLICEIFEDAEQINTVAYSSKNVIDIMEHEFPNLLLIDECLNFSDIKTIIKNAKNKNPLIKIFVISSKRNTEAVKAKHDLDVDLFISKPFSPEFVFIKAHEVLDIVMID